VELRLRDVNLGILLAFFDDAVVPRLANTFAAGVFARLKFV
jgi:hypothetical protein